MLKSKFLITCISVLPSLIFSSLNFISIGDWGGAALGGQFEKNVYAVAEQMTKTAQASKPSFVLNTGDNFYWCGIQNTTDFQIKADWIDPYSDESLQIPWYSILGNHEYGYNPQAQVDLSNIYSNWVMDSRYYTRRVELDAVNNIYLSLIFLDTSPCVASYRSNNPDNWDPCMTQYPTCSMINTDDDFEGPCMFHENIITQNCPEQYSWLSNTLANVPKSDWLIISGHHPIDEVNIMDFTSLIQSHGFSMYFNGHSHTLSQYTIDNSGVYITSGAGALVNTPDQDVPETRAKVDGLDLPAEISRPSHSYQTVYNNKIAGFTQHVFSDDFSTVTSNFISYAGDIIHTFKSNKIGELV